MNRVMRKIVINNNIGEKAIERHPVPILGIDYKVKIVYKNIKLVELDLEGRTIKISLPNRYKKSSNKQVLDYAIEKLYEQIAKVEIERAMEKTRLLLDFAPEEYEIVKMKTYGKCEYNRISINPKVVKFNRKVIDYIVLHQYCHLKYRTHSKAFFNLIKKYEPEYEKYERILLDSKKNI